MIVYKDQCFCVADCANHKCPRNLNFVDLSRTDLPIAQADLSETCSEYIKRNKKKTKIIKKGKK